MIVSENTEVVEGSQRLIVADILGYGEAAEDFSIDCDCAHLYEEDESGLG